MRTRTHDCLPRLSGTHARAVSRGSRVLVHAGLLAKGENDEVMMVATGETKDRLVVDSFAAGQERTYAVRDSSDFEIAELQLLRLI